MAEIGIGVIGGGYMGKAHSVAMASVGAVFDTALRPRLEMIAATSAASAERYRAAYGYARAAGDWRVLVADPKVEAIVIASPQDTHRAIAEAAFALGKPVLCEKPLADTLEDARAMVAASCWPKGCWVKSRGFAPSIPKTSLPTRRPRLTGAALGRPMAIWAISPRIRSTPRWRSWGQLSG